MFVIIHAFYTLPNNFITIISDFSSYVFNIKAIQIDGLYS